MKYVERVAIVLFKFFQKDFAVPQMTITAFLFFFLQEIRSFFGLYFPAFGLNMRKYSVSLRIQYERRKIRTRKLRVWALFTQMTIELRLL